MKTLQLLTRKLKLSMRATKFSATIGIIVSFITFFEMNMMAAVNYTVFLHNSDPATIVNQASVYGGLEHYAVGILFLVIYCFIAIFASIVATELFIRLCDVFKWKPRLYYIIVKSEFKKDCFEEELNVKINKNGK